MGKVGRWKFYNPQDGPMRVAGLMSGSGTNLRRIIELEMRLKEQLDESPFEVVVIFSDNADSNAAVIGKDYDKPIVIRDKRAFYKARNKPLSDMDVRADFDAKNVDALEPYCIDIAAYAGYESIATEPLVEAFSGINIHPCDLAVKGEDGKPAYVGLGNKAVAKPILAGEKTIRSSTHFIEKEVDCGRVLMRSPTMEVNRPADFDPNDKEMVTRVADEHQDKLKEVGDWVAFPATIQAIAEGRFEEDEHRNLYFDGELIPNGVDMETTKI